MHTAFSLRRHAWPLVLVILATAASALVVVLAFRMRDLGDEVRRLRFERNLPRAGDVAPPLRVATLGGDSVHLARLGSDRWQLWFVFNTTCPFCRASVAGWKSIVARLPADSGVEVLGLALDSLDATRAYASAHHLPFPVAVLSARQAAMYRMAGVPLAVVLDTTGVIRFVHAGTVSASVADSVVALLGARSSAQLVAGR